MIVGANWVISVLIVSPFGAKVIFVTDFCANNCNANSVTISRVAVFFISI